MDEYARGRLSVIKEIREYCQNEIKKTKVDNDSDNIHHNIKLSGMRKGFRKVIQRLSKKEKNTLEHDQPND